MESVTHPNGLINTMTSPYELNWDFRSSLNCIFSKVFNNPENVNLV